MRALVAPHEPYTAAEKLPDRALLCDRASLIIMSEAGIPLS